MNAMNTFLLKIIMMPLVIGGVTIASKKWGNAIGGLLASLPWIGGSMILFFVFEQGVDFAVNSVKGMMLGLIGVIAFCYAYINACFSFKWYICLCFGYVAFAVTTYTLPHFEAALTLNQWYILAMVSTFLFLLFFPKLQQQQSATQNLRFDIYLRMATITLAVVLITYLADVLGPTLSGILTLFPIITAILSAFTHYTQGVNATLKILRGFITGFIGFGTYLFLQAKFLPIYSVGGSVLFALIINIVLNLLMRHLVEKRIRFHKRITP
jgi:hypothetical protein